MRAERLVRADAIARATWIKRYGYTPERIREQYSFMEDNRERILGVLRKTQCPCSCWMCGNPRRQMGEITLQEKIANINEAEQKEELYENLGYF